MTSTQQPNTSPKKSSPRAWVWHCTDDSIAAGQISVLSLLETVLAVSLYIWLAFQFEHQWWLLISAVAAPIILLRSPESKALGVKWLKSYWDVERKWEDISLREKIIVLSITALCTSSLTWWLTSNVLLQQHGWEFFWRATFLGFIALALVLAFALGFALVGAGVGAVAFVGARIDVSVIAVAVALVVIGANSKYRGLSIPANITVIVSFLPSFALGIWLRGLLIRIFATLRHPLAGLRQLPVNWRETIAVIDFTHPPELLPGAAAVADALTVRGLLQDISLTDEESWFSMAIALIWYVPALMWRWSLKATLWLWFPLALLLRPNAPTDNAGQVRKNAVTQIWVSTWLAAVAVVVAFWLAKNHFSPDTIKSSTELAGENIGKWLEKLSSLASPPSGLIEIALWICCVLVGMVWLYSQYIQKQSPKTFAEEDAIYEMHDEPKKMFFSHTRILTRLYTFSVVSFIVLGYSVVLHLAKLHYPNELMRFVPTWLLEWL